MDACEKKGLSMLKETLDRFRDELSGGHLAQLAYLI